MATPTYTRQFACLREQSVVNDGGVGKGNGNDKHVPIGRDPDNGDVYRAYMRFDLNFSGVYQIVAAHFVFMSSARVHLNYGSTRQFRARAVTERLFKTGGGSEGVWSASAPEVYPGPTPSGTTFDTSGLVNAENIIQRLDITSMVDGWAPDFVLKSDGVNYGDGDTNYGFRLYSPDEGDTTQRYEIRGMRSTTPIRKPYIELEYISNHPPDVPTVNSPAQGDPTSIPSLGANTLTVQFVFSDEDIGDTCQRAELQVWSDGSTDVSLGTLITTTGAVTPSSTGQLDTYSVTVTGLTPRTNQRYRLRVQDNNDTWSGWTSLTDGRVYPTYIVGAPTDSQMTTIPDSVVVSGSLNSQDPADYITGWNIEAYRQSDGVVLWAPQSPIDIGGTSRRSSVDWAGQTLNAGDTVRWRHRHVNRDGALGEWSGYFNTTMVVDTGPDNMSPTDTTTKLLTRTPTLTIGHSSSFDAYQWRLYLNDSVIYDSGLQLTATTSSVNVTPASGLLHWGDGGDENPLEWDAAVRVGGTLSEFSPRYPIRINSLPSTTLTVEDRTALGYVPDSDPTLTVPYEDTDRYAYSEWPEGQEFEIRDGATPQGSGALVQRRHNVERDELEIVEWVRVGRQVHALQSATDWTGGSLSVSTYSATNPSGYSGNSLQFAASSLGASATATYDGDTFDLRGYGSTAYLRVQRRFTSTTNLGSWRLRLSDGTNYWEYVIADSGDSTSTWAEVVLPLYSRDTDSGTLDWSAVDILGVTCIPSGGSYTGNLQIRDWRIGLTQTDADSPTGDLVADSSYDARVRYRDDASAKMSTTLAANSSAGASNVKVASVTNIAVGDSLTITSSGVPETRQVSAVGTAGSGGTGITVTEGYTVAHSSGDTTEVRYWGPWSEWATFIYASPPGVAANAPADLATVNNPTQTLSWTWTSSKEQEYAIIYIWERVSGVDELIWQYTQDGDAVTYDIPPFLLATGKTYAWQIEAVDTDGLSDSTTTRTFDTSFSAPSALTGLTLDPDDAGSFVEVTWTASTDPYLHHYRVWWQRADGVWVRVDGGPAALGDGKTPLTTASFTFYGARLGTNVFRVEAHNGAQASAPAYSEEAELNASRPGSFMLAAADGSLSVAVNPTSASRARNPLTEVYRPPGRGSSILLSWGISGISASLTFEYIPADDGGVSAALDDLLETPATIYVKWPTPYGWEPLPANLTALTDNPSDGGLANVTATFEEVEV